MQHKVFSPTGLGETIFRERYALTPDESWSQACYRVSNHVGTAELENVDDYKNLFYQELVTNKFMPGGRIWYGAGRNKAQLLNCYVVPTVDSREGWGDTTKDTIVISGLGGGVGINFSPIRPRGANIKGTGGVATGSVSLMQLIDGVGDVLVSGGGRRLALMFCLAIDHPDIEEFLHSKLDEDQLNNANMSVILDFDPKEFSEKVNNGGKIPLVFEGKEYGELDAISVWKKIVKHAWANGEPGVLNQHLAEEMNNIHYYKPVISTNPCGEQWLEAYGACDLGALVLPRFVEDGTFRWGEFDDTIRTAVRFLDDVLDVNYYPNEKIKDNCEAVRRIGLGVMGLHSMLMDLGMKYSSHEAIEFEDKLFDTIKNIAYQESVELAKEKGQFPAYQKEFLDSGFVKTLDDDLRGRIDENGIRNCTLMTVAPTGTTSIVAGVSSGIEPLPAVVYNRSYKTIDDRANETLKSEIVVDPSYYEYSTTVLESASDLHPKTHFEVQKTIQKHVDNSISKTINLPKDYPINELGYLWLEYLPYMKGSTFYRWGSREFEPISPIPKEEWYKYVGEVDTKETEEIYDDCVGGVCAVG
jgi:ribonucleoside-diphosphate reductase alpha chain